jgi:hypothetical protein
MIQVFLTQSQGGQQVGRSLLADTGAGSMNSPFELLLEEQDCLLCGGITVPGVVLGGAYIGPFPRYLIRVCVPAIGFDQEVPVAGVPAGPVGFDGIACFPFLNRFSYGNFGNRGIFGLES